MKRGRQEIDMANCLMLLSKVGQNDKANHVSSRVFTCKTCNREFPSFQALGGHRASHKKLKLMGENHHPLYDDHTQLPVSPKKHKCSLCGLEFALGQALGGHMRRHRANNNKFSIEEGLFTRPLLPMPVMMKRSNSSKRVLCLDLNLAPPENDLTLELGKMMAHPVVDFFM